MQFDYIKLRRYFHQNPELSLKEFNTASKIQEVLQALHIPYQSEIAGTGICALIEGKNAGKCLAIRADMDALPICETNRVPYKSDQTGVMHACGHDAHMATVLMAAEMLNTKKDILNGSIKLIFQPAEETTGGALPMIQAGVLENPVVDACVGFHVRPELECGKIICAAGKLMASPDNFYIRLFGKGGHCATPKQNDPLIAIACTLCQALTEIQYPDSLLTVCTIHSGDAPNVMSDTLTISGSFRTFDETTRTQIAKDIENTVNSICQAHAIRGETQIEFLYPPLQNDEFLTKKMQKAAMRVVGDENVIKTFTPSMLGEDFSYFGTHVPAVYFYLGTAMENRKTTLHAADFDINEDAIEIAAKTIFNFAEQFLS